MDLLCLVCMHSNNQSCNSKSIPLFILLCCRCFRCSYLLGFPHVCRVTSRNLPYNSETKSIHAALIQSVKRNVAAVCAPNWNKVFNDLEIKLANVNRDEHSQHWGWSAEPACYVLPGSASCLNLQLTGSVWSSMPGKRSCIHWPSHITISLTGTCSEFISSWSHVPELWGKKPLSQVRSAFVHTWSCVHMLLHSRVGRSHVGLNHWTRVQQEWFDHTTEYSFLQSICSWNHQTYEVVSLMWMAGPHPMGCKFLTPNIKKNGEKLVAVQWGELCMCVMEWMYVIFSITLVFFW